MTKIIKSNFLKKIFNSEFNQNVLTLMTGSIIAQAIPIAITPILTRLYDPKDFGILALFLAVSTVLSSIASARYEMAIILPDKDEDAINLALLCLIIITGFSMSLFFIFFILNEQIYILLKNEEISFWLYFIPIVVFMNGMYNVLKYLNIRKKLYKNIATSSIFKSSSASSVQLLIGIFKSSELGLILGQIVSPFFGNIRLSKNIIKKYDLKKINNIKIKYLAKRHSNFPKFGVWSILCNSLSYNMNNILISAFYSLSTLGFYSMVERVLSLPTSLLGKSVGEVYLQEANKEKQKTGKATIAFNSTFKKLLLISILIFVPLFFILPNLFKVVLGSEWQIAGEYAQIILPFVGIQFIVATLSITNIIFEKQKIAFFWQLGLFLGSIATIFYANINGISFQSFLKIYTIFLFSHYCFLLVIIKKVSNKTL